MDILCFTSIIAYILVPSLKISSALDSIAQPNNLTDANTLVSRNGTFELGFFIPGSSKKRYLGIWYNNIPLQTVVWVANRLNPINDSSGVLQVQDNGNLVLTQNGAVVWNTTSVKQAQNPVAQLLDSGNLVVRDIHETNPEAYLWQSFDYPSDTLLPGMKLGCDLITGLNRSLTSWKSWDDPSPGDLSWVMDPRDFPESYFMKGNKKYYRSGPWNGQLTSGSPDLTSSPYFDPYFEFNDREVYYSYSAKNSFISRLVMNQTHRHRYVWFEHEQNWKVVSKVPRDVCDIYAYCGDNATCKNITDSSPMCQCLKGFRPKSPQSWNSMNWSEGCVRNVELSCKDKDKDWFESLAELKLPETTHTFLDKAMNIEQCREKCLNNYSCTAYANSNIRGEDYGCVMWFGDLIDIKQFQANGQNLYIRKAASEAHDEAEEHGRGKKLTTIVATTIAAISGMVLLACYFIYRVRRNRNENLRNIGGETENSVESEDDLDVPLFDLSTLVIATDNFSENNKIGEGGFGQVYKGILENGQEIAVKKLSRSSGQGMTEFKNEVKLIAKLQHRNLVRLLGCCLQRQESQDKMLVYEYMPNGSLDYFIFDDNKGNMLNWSRRFRIICGIARGLLYLHEDSRLRIIHRDLKASNILLDEKLNPKISDFGMARIFGGNQTEENTKRVVGTYGYMSPEYAADGLFSIKSDIFSFGILLLEIISGKKNKGFYQADQRKNLASHAWILWREGRALDLVDKNMEQLIASEVLRCIHISLLCVQHHPGDRPTMSLVVLMLGSENKLTKPKQPGFFPGKDYIEASSSSSQPHSESSNKMTITLLEAR